MEAVLNITELTELILVNVDIQTLLTSATRVNKGWNHLISTSPTLQSALFFRPVDGDGKDQDATSPPVFNPFLVQKFGTCFFNFGPLYDYMQRAESFYSMPWTSKPYQTKLAPTGSGYKNHYRLFKPERLTAQQTLDEMTNRRRFTRRDASWRRMLVTQPPPANSGHLRWECAEDIWPSIEHLSSSLLINPKGDGLRMGVLYDFIQHHAIRHPKDSLFFRVVWKHHPTHLVQRKLQEYRDILFTQTTVIIEMLDETDDSDVFHIGLDPTKQATFDETFRCDETDDNASLTSLDAQQFVHRQFQGDTIERVKSTVRELSIMSTTCPPPPPTDFFRRMGYSP